MSDFFVSPNRLFFMDPLFARFWCYFSRRNIFTWVSCFFIVFSRSGVGVLSLGSQHNTAKWVSWISPHQHVDKELVDIWLILVWFLLLTFCFTLWVRFGWFLVWFSTNFFFFHQHRYVSQIYLLKYRSEIENKITRVLCSQSQDTTDYFQSFSNWLKCWLLDYSIKFFRSANRTQILKPIITILSL